jgi:uncharacterized protein YqgQ
MSALPSPKNNEDLVNSLLNITEADSHHEMMKFELEREFQKYLLTRKKFKNSRQLSRHDTTATSSMGSDIMSLFDAF